MYAPLAAAINPASRTGIIGFSQQISYDGKFALVEFVARDRAAFRQILTDKDANPQRPLSAAFINAKTWKRNSYWIAPWHVGFGVAAQFTQF